MTQEVNASSDSIEGMKAVLDGFDYDDEELDEIEVTFHLDLGIGDSSEEITPPDEPTNPSQHTRSHFVLSTLFQQGAEDEQDSMATSAVQERMKSQVEGDISRPSGELSRLYGEFGMVDRHDPPQSHGYSYYLTDAGVEFIEEFGVYPSN